MRRFLFFALPPFAYALAIFALSSTQVRGAPDVPGFDKLAHFGVYGGLAFLVSRALNGYRPSPRAAAIGGALIASVYGATDEIHQSFTPGRSPEVLDWVADTAGGIAFAAAWYALWRWRSKEART